MSPAGHNIGGPVGVLPTVVSEGKIKLGDIEVTVFHLSNGERVIDGDSVREILRTLFGEDDQ